MSLTPGARLGPYEVVSRVGAGGMGEVYRAIDTRLDRTVAVKVLPPDRVSDLEARGRFEREAKSIAALNHPNICAIHDVGLGDPSTPPYLVMELLEGQTLQERLLRGPLDIDHVLEYGAALADALDMAHARGLIHRDLKPANIFITARGIPKILDFGLAKALAPAGSAAAGDPDVTRRSADALTEMGTTVGTVAYMSPEQLRGETLDVRSDLFSFGLVLYEMATGQRAFAGGTSAFVSAAILVHEPVPPTEVRPDLPAKLEETILKALEKDRNVRCQSAAELRADLTRLKRQSGSSQATRAAVPASASSPLITTLSGPRTAAASGIPSSMMTASAAGRTAAVDRSPESAGNPVRTSGGRGVLIGVAALALAGLLAGGYWLGVGRGDSGGAAPTPAPVRPADPPPPPAANAAPEKSSPTPAPATTPPTTPSSSPTSLTTVGPPATPPPASSAAAVTSTAAGTPPGADDRKNPRGGRIGAGRRGGPAMLPALITTLKALPPLSFDLAYATGDDHVRDLAEGLRQALVASGWTCASMTQIPGQHPPVTVFVPQPSPRSGALINWARRNGFDTDVKPAPRLPRLRIVIGKQ